MYTEIDFFAKVVASLVAMIQLYVSWLAVESSLTKAQKNVVQFPPVVVTLLFGTSYAACSNATAAALACSIVVVFFTLIDGFFPDVDKSVFQISKPKT